MKNLIDMSKEKESTYKPLLFTTTMRNPSRVKDFLSILYQHEGEILTKELIKKIEKEIFKYGLYRPSIRSEEIKMKWNALPKGKIAEVPLNEEETEFLYENNIQNHKEAGFEWGWPSRFDTQFKMMKVWGFVNYSMDGKIEFSKLGKKLAESVKIGIDKEGNIEYKIIDKWAEELVFTQVFAKYQRGNPFIREENSNKPLYLLLKVIGLLNGDHENDTSTGSSKGINRNELPLLLCWKDNDADSLYNEIKAIRSENKYKSDTRGVVLNYLTDKKIAPEKKFDEDSLFIDYTDDFIRKMQFTGLITIRGAGTYIDCNERRKKIISLIIDNYSEIQKFENIEDYYGYMSKPDENIISAFENIKNNNANSNNKLKNWIENNTEFGLDDIYNELDLLCKNKKEDVNSKFSLLSRPKRFEFLTAVAIQKKFDNVTVSPRYSSDDDGFPKSTASGNGGDIECIEEGKGILVEVTLLQGRNQTTSEVLPVKRHLEEFDKDCNQKRPAYSALNSIFIAPTLYPDTIDQFDYESFKSKWKYSYSTFTITNFINFLTNSSSLLSEKESNLEGTLTQNGFTKKDGVFERNKDQKCIKISKEEVAGSFDIEISRSEETIASIKGLHSIKELQYFLRLVDIDLQFKMN